MNNYRLYSIVYAFKQYGMNSISEEYRVFLKQGKQTFLQQLYK